MSDVRNVLVAAGATANVDLSEVIVGVHWLEDTHQWSVLVAPKAQLEFPPASEPAP